MKKKKNFFQRAMALLLAAVLSIPSGVSFVSAADTSNSGISSDGISLQLEWENTEFTEGLAYNLEANYNTSNSVRLKVSYSCAEVREEGYEAGDLIITVKGIGDVGREELIEAVVGADKESASKKVRDWTYNWNEVNDTYTFYNNEPISGSSVFSGYFELVWDVVARDSVHNYSQSDIQAIMYMPSGEVVETNCLTFTNHTMADTYEVYIEQQEMYGYEGLTSGISKPDDYAFVRYNLGAAESKNSRGLINTYYTFNPDTAGVGVGAIVISPVLDCKDNGNGTYRLSLEYLSDTISMEDQYVYVAYPKGTDSYGDKNVYASLTKYGMYHEGDDSGRTGMIALATATIGVPVQSDFDFVDIPGDIYQYWKDTYYDKYVDEDDTLAQGGDISGRKMVAGTTQTYYLEGELNNPTGINYTLEMVDDYIYILQNNGAYRQLDKSEYDFVSVTIPGTPSLKNSNGIAIKADTYQVLVYAAQNGNQVDVASMTPYWGLGDGEGLIRSYNQEITLPANTTSIAVVFVDLKESIKVYSIPVDINFHIKDTTELTWEQQDNLSSGQVVNTSFIRVYYKSAGETDYTWLNDTFTENHYEDDTNLGLAAKDLQIYGSYLDREKDAITFFEADKDNYHAFTWISSVATSGSRLTSTVRIGADFDFGDNIPSQYSLYTILPESLSLIDYKIEQDIWDIMELYGKGFNEQELAAACTPEIIEDYKGSGRTYIALHFDFGNLDVPRDSYIRASIKTKVDPTHLKGSSSIVVKSCVLIDAEINEYTIGKEPDDGLWASYFASELYADIDRDGDSAENLADDLAFVSYIYADSSQFEVSKYVQTSYSDGLVHLPDVPSEVYGGTYQYYLTIRNGNSTSTDIVLTDILETGANAQWQGTLQSVDLSECETLGLTGTVWYSASTDPGTVGGSDWSQTLSPSQAKAIAIDFGDSVLAEGEELRVIVNMKAPTDTTLKNQVTENGFAVSMTMKDSTSGNTTKYDSLESNLVQVQLTPALHSVIVTKVDAVDGNVLAGAKFSLIDKAANTIIATATSNSRGYAIFHNVPGNSTYLIRENTAPDGYNTAADTEITVADSDVNVTIKDTRSSGVINVFKTNSLDPNLAVAGAVYTLYAEDGTTVGTATTDSDGIAVFTGLAWGTYTVKETKAPDGYLLNEMTYTVEIDRSNTLEAQQVNVFDVQDDIFIHLQKYVMTTTGAKTTIPLAGATFELIRVSGETEQRIGLYVTDKDGKIDITNLPYGEYYFKEYRAPAGYDKAESVSFTLSPDNQEFSCIVYDKRQPGSILITKKDNLGNMVEGAEFTLYNEDGTEAKDATGSVIKVKSDEYGLAQIDDLEWGTYYLQETVCAEYYQPDSERKEIVISGSTLSVPVTFINETVKGAVLLIKTDESEKHLLPGAEFVLYQTNGTLIGTYTTDANGQILIEDMEWGSYYFKEITAPTGYGLTDELIRFSVNALNAGITQELTVSDPLEGRSITLTKRISANDINFANGDPTFVFKIEGTDVNGVSHTYYRLITFTEDFVKTNTANGYVSQSFTISELVAGNYTVAEVDSSRYALSQIGNVVNGTAASDGKSVTLDVLNYTNASAVFTNNKYEHQDFSHNDNETNILKQYRKLTALTVNYGATTAQAESAINTDILEVVAYYDDGTKETLNPSQYVMTIDGEEVTNFPNKNGSYTVTVSYTEHGITKSGTFTVTLSGMKVRIVSLSASLLVDPTVYTESAITTDMFSVTATYNTGATKTLATTEYTVTPTTAPSVAGDFDVTIALNLSTVPNDGYGVSTTASMTAKYKTLLEPGPEFNAHIPDTATALIFTDSGAPTGIVTTDVSNNKDGSVVAWLDDTTFYVSAAEAGQTIIANEDCTHMFYNTELSSIIFNGVLDTSQTVNMTEMFRYCNEDFTELDLSTFDTSNVVYMTAMFESCNDLTSLDLSSFDTSNVKMMNAMFNFCSSLETITFGDKWTTSNVENMTTMFYSCRALKELDIADWDLSNCIATPSMFYYCAALTELDVSDWDMSNVMFMDGMFSYCSGLTELDLTKWDTSSLKNIRQMFRNCTGLTTLDLTAFNTKLVTDMAQTFYNCTNLTTVYVSGLWDTSAVSSSYNMFTNSSSLVGGAGTVYDSSNVTVTYAHIDEGTDNPGYFTGVSLDYGHVPIGTTITPTVSASDGFTIAGYEIVSGSEHVSLNASTGAVTGVSQGTAVVKVIATNASGVTLTSCDTIQVGVMSYAIYSADDGSLTFCHSGERIVEGQTYKGKTATKVYTDVETSNYSFDEFAFTGTVPWYVDGTNLLVTCVSFADEFKPLDISGWFCNFENCTKIDLTNLDTSACTSMAALFNDCYVLDEIIYGDKWTTVNVTDMQSMFYACSSLKTIDLSGLDTSKVTNMSYMFGKCSAVTELDVSKFDTSNVTQMHYMFYYCSALEKLNLSSWDTSQVQTLKWTFGRCYALEEITFGDLWDTSNVQNMYATFVLCTSLKKLDLSFFDTSNVEDMAYMFEQCTALTDLNVTSFDISNSWRLDGMFYLCESLTVLDLSSWDTSNIDYMDNTFQGCSNLATIYVSDLWSMDGVYSTDDMFTDCTSLVGGAGTAYDATYIDGTYAKIDGGADDPGYFTDIAAKANT